METMRLGRNDVCRCGSGKKYKKCCLAHAEARTPPRPVGRNGEQLGFLQTPAQMAEARELATIPLPKEPPTNGHPSGPTYWQHPPGQPNAAPPAGGEWVEYVFVKDQGWTHERDLKPGDQYRLKGGAWETVPPDRVIGTTEEQPFFVQGKGWTPLREIKPGDLLRTEDGWVPVKSIEDTGRYETVYNLRVADYHTYFVGAPEWGFAVWAHNTYNVTNLAGKTRADAHIAIRQAGYNYHGTTAGGYVRYRHPGGAEIQIRPNGEVIRLGPPVTPTGGGRPYRPRIDHTGNPIPTHHTGEFLPPLPPRRLP